jgi:hypothetical protein
MLFIIEAMTSVLYCDKFGALDTFVSTMKPVCSAKV